MHIEIVILCWIVGLLLIFGSMVRDRRRARRYVWELERRDREYRIDVQLWELLHEEDPNWLADMGIEPPLYVQRSQKPLCKSPQPTAYSLIEFATNSSTGVINGGLAWQSGGTPRSKMRWLRKA